MSDYIEIPNTIKIKQDVNNSYFWCILGIHTYEGVYVGEGKKCGNTDAIYDMCPCGHGRRRYGKGPFPNARIFRCETRGKKLYITLGKR